jgi:hypothetical protein
VRLEFDVWMCSRKGSFELVLSRFLACFRGAVAIKFRPGWLSTSFCLDRVGSVIWFGICGSDVRCANFGPALVW